MMRAGSSSSRISERAVTLLPEPLSPTMPSVSPGPTVKETPSTARTAPASVRKTVWRSLTSSTGTVPGPFLMWQASARPRVEPVAQPVAAGS
jgi:hypothetical protein